MNSIENNSDHSIEREHFAQQFRFMSALVILLVVAFLSVVVACSVGRIEIPFWITLKSVASGIGLIDGSNLNATHTAIFDIRLSRVCLSAMVGLALSVSGAAFQGILRNPLADPFTIGVSAGGAFGAALVIFLGFGSNSAMGLGMVPLAALIGALSALAAVVSLARVDGMLRRDTMVLAGIVVATFLGALVSLLKSLDEESVASIVFWVMGSFQGRGWYHALFAFPYLVVGLILVVVHSREIDVMSLGDVPARQLGVDVNKARLRVLIGASLLTAAAVSVSGVIGFVGLVAPHLVRMTLGPNHTRLFVLAGLLGMIAMIWSDVAARTILPDGEELPVGVITALFGGPFFCALLKSTKTGTGFD
jgi:iron complex transport system permease protein